jgi:hypothetical protein
MVANTYNSSSKETEKKAHVFQVSLGYIASQDLKKSH